MQFGGRKKLHNYSYTFFNMPKHVSKVAQTASQHCVDTVVSVIWAPDLRPIFYKNITKIIFRVNVLQNPGFGTLETLYSCTISNIF